jgi:NADAR domain
MAAHGLYTWDIVPNWTEMKFDRMRSVLRAKFSQHEDLRELLLQTGDARIVEVGRTDSPVNRVWGEVNGKGLNMLGVLLMEIHCSPSTIDDQLIQRRPVFFRSADALINVLTNYGHFSPSAELSDFL